MTKKTIYGGFGILLALTIVVAAGIFFVQRFNGIASAESKIQESAAQIDVIVDSEKTAAENLLKETSELKDTEEYKDLTWVKVSLTENPSAFFKDDIAFQETLIAYLDIVSKNEKLSGKESVGSILGELRGSAGILRTQKIEYNDRVDEYYAQRNRRPQIVATILKFQEYRRFVNIPKPLDAQETPATPSDDQPVNDINSFN